MTAPLIRQDLAAMLPRTLKRTGHPAKVLCFKAGVSKRVIEGIKRGEHVISAAALLALAQHYPEVRALVISLLGPVEQDPARAMDAIAKTLGGK